VGGEGFDFASDALSLAEAEEQETMKALQLDLFGEPQ